MYRVPVQGKQQPRRVAGDPVRHELSRQTLLGMETALNDRFQCFIRRQAHLRPFRVVIHADVVRAHEQGGHTLGGQHFARAFLTVTGPHLYQSVSDHVVVQNLRERNKRFHG